MKKTVMILATAILATSAFAGSTWIKIGESNGKAVSKVTIATAKAYTPDAAKNEYPVDTVFPAVDMMYWKKSGNDWVEMNQAEKDAVDAAIRDEAETEAVADAQIDALLRAIADNIAGKSYEDIKASFKANVDPKKHKDKKKNKK